MRRCRGFLARMAAAAWACSCSRARCWLKTPCRRGTTPDPRRRSLGFVERVTKNGSPDFVPPDQRVATFDNDGTLWGEQPLYFQLFFAIDRVKALAPQHPEWKDKEPFASLLKGDVKAALAGGEHAILEIMMATHAGMTTDAFETIVKDWVATAKHPATGRLYTEMVYQPMLELLGHLRANGFKTFIVSGGGVEFMRAFAEKVYGIPPEQVVGSSGVTTFEMRQGTPVLVKEPKVEFVDDKTGKPSASTGSSAAVRSSPSATRTATSRCCNGRRRAAVRV